MSCTGDGATVVLWDIDGTLLDSGRLAAGYYSDALSRVLSVPAADDLADTLRTLSGGTDRRIAAVLLDAVGETAESVSPDDFLTALTESLHDLRESIVRLAPPLPGAVRLLASAAEAGLAQTVVTGNLGANARLKLRAHGLHRHLELSWGGYGDSAERREDLVTASLGRIRGALPGAEVCCVLIGDSVHDVSAARATGVPCVAVATGAHTAAQLADAGADLVVGDLTELTPAILTEAARPVPARCDHRLSWSMPDRRHRPHSTRCPFPHHQEPVRPMFLADEQNDHDEAIAALDPLDADELMSRLPQANQTADIDWLDDALHTLTARAARVDDPDHARAALRDIGFLAASRARHDPRTPPTAAVEHHLVRLSRLADEVPRDTVYSYASRNPSGARRRTFTDTPNEHLFIDQVTRGTVELNHALELCLLLARRLLADPVAATESAEALTGRLRTFTQCLLTVKRSITPEFFTGELRPYFPPLLLAGATYYGPGGAQMPMFVLDVLLLRNAGSPEHNSWHVTYLNENGHYLPPAHRLVVAQGMTRSGVVSQALTDGTAERYPNVRDALIGVVHELLRFRYPHRMLAKANMQVRPEGSLGSGGYTVEALDRLVELTAEAKNSSAPIRRVSH